MTLYQKFKKLKIDFSAIGLEQRGTDVKYFCTPKGARIIGSAGVDGIHYCFVRGQEEMVFAVSPMNTPGRNVFPIARTFEDLLRLLLACGDLAAVEQAHQWDEEQFEEFLAENPPTDKALAVFAVLRDKLGVTPMEEPFAYIRQLQDSYNYGQLSFSKEYYEAFDAAPADELPTEWKVTLEGGFHARRGKAGKEIAIGKQFMWGDEVWHVPAVYLCSGGLVIDFCVEVNGGRLQSFCEKWNRGRSQTDRFTDEDEEQMESENPLTVDFRPVVHFNGVTLQNKEGHGTGWIPEGNLDEAHHNSWEAGRILEHYALDPARIWVMQRCSFPWIGKRPAEILSLKLKLERERTNIAGERFTVSAVGDVVRFTHPLSGEEHILTIQEYEAQEMDTARFHDNAWEYPSHYIAMTYTVWPELPNEAFFIKDSARGDSPRQKAPDPNGRYAMSAGVIGMIRRSADAPALFHEDGSPAKAHPTCSSLHFQPVKDVEWRMLFREKLMPDVDVELV